MKTSTAHWLTAGLIAAGIGPVAAADLPLRKSAPVEYVRICDAFGQGFFFIPGSDTCLRVSGQVRAEATVRGGAPTSNAGAFAYNQAGNVYRRDFTVLRARGYLNADSRTQTAYGTLRAFVSMRLTIDTTPPGPFGGRGGNVVSGSARASTGLFQGLSQQQASLDKGFIQFAGFTAGRAQSFFDFDAQSYELLSNSIANSNQVTELFAYTATFGKGFSATISVEDATEREIGDNGSFVFNNFTGLPPAKPTFNVNNPTATNASVLAYGGETLPDIVGNLRYDADWGSAQLSGAYHRVRSLPVALLGGVGKTVTPQADGFAALGGVKILLPMLAKGDSITLQGSYQQGAMDYVNPINYLPNGITNVYGAQTNGVESQFGIPVNDAFVNPAGAVVLSRAAGFYGAVRHYFIPDVYSSLFGSYIDIENPRSAQRLGAGTDNATVFQVGFNTVWTPVKDFQIGGEILYTDLAYRGLAVLGTTPSEVDDIRGRLSLRRAF